MAERFKYLKEVQDKAKHLTTETKNVVKKLNASGGLFKVLTVTSDDTTHEFTMIENNTPRNVDIEQTGRNCLVM